MNSNSLVSFLLKLIGSSDPDVLVEVDRILEDLLTHWKYNSDVPTVKPDTPTVLVYNRWRTISLRYNNEEWSLQQWSPIGHDLVWYGWGKQAATCRPDVDKLKKEMGPPPVGVTFFGVRIQ